MALEIKLMGRRHLRPKEIDLVQVESKRREIKTTPNMFVKTSNDRKFFKGESLLWRNKYNLTGKKPKVNKTES